MRSLVLAVFLVGAAAGAGGCTATVAADAYPPDLVYVSPGVQVIANYGEPIFYSDGLYWRYHGGVWYRSSYYTGGWVYARPPVAVMRINSPHSYTYYRPPGWRGHPRTVGPAPAPGWRGAPASPGYRGAAPPPSAGWRGSPATAPPSAGWRGAPPPAAARRPAPSYSAPRAAPAPGRSGGGGSWRGNPR
jgi:hypothetical protein